MSYSFLANFYLFFIGGSPKILWLHNDQTVTFFLACHQELHGNSKPETGQLSELDRIGIYIYSLKSRLVKYLIWPDKILYTCGFEVSQGFWFPCNFGSRYIHPQCFAMSLLFIQVTLGNWWTGKHLETIGNCRTKPGDHKETILKSQVWRFWMPLGYV